MANDLLVVVLAAGASRRLGQPKQLVLLQGEPLLRRQCRLALDANVGQVAVILGCLARDCETTIDDLPVTVWTNGDWQEGLASSIRHATHKAQEIDAQGLMLLHADQYRLMPADLQRLHHAWLESPTSACVAAYGDDFGPPVIFPNAFFDQLRQLRGDVGARRVLANLAPRDLKRIPVPNALADLDLPQQLAESFAASPHEPA